MRSIQEQDIKDAMWEIEYNDDTFKLTELIAIAVRIAAKEAELVINSSEIISIFGLYTDKLMEYIEYTLPQLEYSDVGPNNTLVYSNDVRTSIGRLSKYMTSSIEIAKKRKSKTYPNKFQVLNIHNVRFDLSHQKSLVDYGVRSKFFNEDTLDRNLSVFSNDKDKGAVAEVIISFILHRIEMHASALLNLGSKEKMHFDLDTYMKEHKSQNHSAILDAQEELDKTKTKTKYSVESIAGMVFSGLTDSHKTQLVNASKFGKLVQELIEELSLD